MILPKGGHYTNGYIRKVHDLTGISSGTIRNAVMGLKHKFNANNIEQAVIVALATGVLDPHELFGSELPQPLKIIMGSEAYRIATNYIATGVYVRSLSDDESTVATEFIKKIGLNGGLYWRSWDQEIGAVTEKNSHGIEGILGNISRKFGISRRGAMFYQISLLLGEPIIVGLPLRVETDINERELEVMLETARTVIPAGGYYRGYAQDISEKLHFDNLHILHILHDVVKKTGTKNPGQAITYFIAHGLISIEDLGIDPNEIPALEAIVSAMRRDRYSAQR